MKENNGSSLRKIKQHYLKNLELDFYELVWTLTKQIPKGKVTTYGAIARALGDVRASRAIGYIEHANPRPVSVPCHRVVYSNGALGGFRAFEGINKKINLLKREGVYVKNGKIIDFEDKLFTDFRITGKPPLAILQEEQMKLQKHIMIKDQQPFNMIKTIGGIDVSYDDDYAFGSVVVLDLGTLEMLEERTKVMKIRFPYIPTYLSYHELPISIQLLNELSHMPDILLFDGNGILHPRGIGLASHAGVILDVPTIGIAKKKLCGEVGATSSGLKNIFEISMGGQQIGFGLKPKTTKKNMVYISPGHKMSFETSLKIAQKICKTRNPEPTRLAHLSALKLRRININ